jgi:hypothetical protein
VPQWDYNWQSAYDLREPKRFPAGTRLERLVEHSNEYVFDADGTLRLMDCQDADAAGV